ncbi:MAG TPA: type I methionyl aminopeptidase [Terriglobales bacterium]|nr:type I methionyl aminopeptidase [Terriglobales bacterium]
MSITSEEELQGMRAAGVVVAKMLLAMKQAARRGVTTGELDAIGANVMREEGAKSAPVLVYGFPGSVCISVNDEAVHGIPGNRPLREGDLLKLDVTVEKDGYMADAAITVAVGETSSVARRLAHCAEKAFQKALGVARAGQPVREIGRVVEEEVHRAGFSVIRDLCGHGIGRTIHEKPSVPNYPDPNSNELLTEGLVITVEPIISAGTGDVFLGQDGWTVRTRDRKLSAHHEHTIMITRSEPVILTSAA